MSKDQQLPCLVIQDANVIIDLVNAGLFEHWFTLKIKTITSDLVESELRKGSQWDCIAPFIESKMIESKTFKPTQMMEIHHLKLQTRVSVPDGSVLYLAKETGGFLLTGDRRLRTAADKLKLAVGGVLWILDRMVEGGAISNSLAASGLKKLLQKGARLPIAEVEKRARLWTD